MLSQELQRHRTFEFGVFGFVDHTHTAFAELRDELVVANGLANHHDRGIVAPWEQRKGPWAVLRVTSYNGCRLNRSTQHPY